MLQVTEFAPDGSPHERTDADLLDLRKGDTTFWVEMSTPTEEEYRSVIQAFDWHPLAIEVLQVDSHLPKVDDYAD